MNKDQLREIGTKLYGNAAWQASMARDLGLAHRTIQRYISGQYDMPGGVLRDLEILIRNYRAAIPATAKERCAQLDQALEIFSRK